MANFEHVGYCPQSDVAVNLLNEAGAAKRLSKARPAKDMNQADNFYQLYGLWTLLGAKIVYPEYDSGNRGSEWKNINKIFTTDSLAHKLMAELVKYHVEAERISVYKIEKEEADSTILDICQSLKCPKLIIESKSEFAVVISDDEENQGIYLNVFYLSEW